MFLTDLAIKYDMQNDFINRLNDYFARFTENQCLGVKWILEEFSDQRVKLSEEDQMKFRDAMDGRI